MENQFPYSDDNKRYHTFNYFLRRHFGGKVFKVPLNAGFTCPNIDGTKGFGGCTYCSGKGSGDFAGDPSMGLRGQFEEIAGRLDKKWPGAMKMPYFQAHSNTYAPLPVLKRCFEEAISFPGIVGMSIATRADCIGEETADYLAELSGRTFLMVELGLQTAHDLTGKRINRCHTYGEFLEGYRRLKDRGIYVCVHIINGLPGETPGMMMETIDEIARLQPDFLKIHLLHLLKGTAMAGEYEAGEFTLMEREDYVKLVCDQLERLPPEMVIQRLTGDGNKQDLIGPLWSLKKFCVLNEIDKEFVRRDSWQGKYWDGGSGKCRISMYM